MKKGDKVVKLMCINGVETAAICEIAAVCKRRGLVSTDTSHVRTAKDIESDGVCTYDLATGLAKWNYLPGCSTRIVPLED